VSKLHVISSRQYGCKKQLYYLAIVSGLKLKLQNKANFQDSENSYLSTPLLWVFGPHYLGVMQPFFCVYLLTSFPFLTSSAKGTFYSESAGEMWNRHIKVPKIAPELLFPISRMNCSDKKLVFSFFCIYQINWFKANTNM
jgi:hypothetical protein